MKKDMKKNLMKRIVAMITAADAFFAGSIRRLLKKAG